MIKKCRAIALAEEMRQLLTHLECHSSDNALLISSDQYLAVGCDLRDLKHLEHILRSHFNMDECSVLFLAEVSITYMDLDAANALIRWAARIGTGESDGHYGRVYCGRSWLTQSKHAFASWNNASRTDQHIPLPRRC